MRRPMGPVRDQIAYGHGQIIIGIHQPRSGGDDSVSVRAVLADHAVMIDRHEREGRVGHPIHHNDVELVDGVDRLGSTPSFSSAARMTSISMTLQTSLT